MGLFDAALGPCPLTSHIPGGRRGTVAGPRQTILTYGLLRSWEAVVLPRLQLTVHPVTGRLRSCRHRPAERAALRDLARAYRLALRGARPTRDEDVILLYVLAVVPSRSPEEGIPPDIPSGVEFGWWRGDHRPRTNAVR